MALSALSLDASRFVSEEELAAALDKDFGRIIPDSAKIVQASDGVITTVLPFVLRSDTVDFADFGVTPGRVLRLTSPPNTPAQKLYGAEGELAAVQSVAGRELTLRRVGEAPGEGPFAVPTPWRNPFTGITETVTVFDQLTFKVARFDGLVLAVTDEIRDELRELADDATITARLSDSRLRRQATLRTASRASLLAASRLGSGGEGPDEMAGKAREYRDEARRHWAEIVDLLRPGRVLEVGSLTFGPAAAAAEWG